MLLQEYTQLVVNVLKDARSKKNEGDINVNERTYSDVATKAANHPKTPETT